MPRVRETRPTVRSTNPVGHGPIRVELYDNLDPGGSALARMLWPDGAGGFTVTPEFFMTVHDAFGKTTGQGSMTEGEGDRFEVEYWTDQQRWEIVDAGVGMLNVIGVAKYSNHLRDSADPGGVVYLSIDEVEGYAAGWLEQQVDDIKILQDGWYNVSFSCRFAFQHVSNGVFEILSFIESERAGVGITRLNENRYGGITGDRQVDDGGMDKNPLSDDRSITITESWAGLLETDDLVRVGVDTGPSFYDPGNWLGLGWDWNVIFAELTFSKARTNPP